MACYPYKCASCGSQTEVFQSIASYSEAPIRPQCCGAEMNRFFTVPMVRGLMRDSFVSPIDGTLIDSHEKQRQHMAEHGVVLYDDVASEIPKKAAARKAAAVADIKSDIIAATHMLEAGHKPPPKIYEADLIPA